MPARKKVFSIAFPQKFAGHPFRPVGAVEREAQRRAGRPGHVALRAARIALWTSLGYLVILSAAIVLAAAGLWVADGA